MVIEIYHISEIIATVIYENIIIFLGGENLYEKFAVLLQQHNVTAYRVSKDTGIPANTFSDWKTGRSKPKIDKLKRLADYFHVSIEYFFEDAGVCERR